MTGVVIRQKRITRKQVKEQRSTTIFVFGDNMERVGLGGQAKEMRGEPNTVGIPTKWSPDSGTLAFFNESTIDNLWVMEVINESFDKLRWFLEIGFDVVIPVDGVGTGLSELPQRAPNLLNYIEEQIEKLGKYR